MRRSRILSGVVAAILVLAVLLLTTGVPSGFLTATIKDRIAHETGYRVNVAGSTRIGLWPSLKVTISEVTLDTRDELAGSRVAVGSIEALMTLGSAWSGRPEITGLVINRPVLAIPLLRQRRPMVAPSATRQMPSPAAADANAPRIEHITVVDGTVVLANQRDHVERRIENVGIQTTISADQRVSIAGNARAGGHPLAFEIKATMPNQPLERQTIPLELALDAPELLAAPVSSKAEVKLNGPLLMINGLSGAIGNGAFDGWASIDFASKPIVKLDLDFRQLDIAAAPAGSAPPAPTAWSDDPINLAGFNYFDAQLRLSAGDLTIGQAHFSPAAIDATVENGVVKCAVRNLGAYDGSASGEIDIDVSSGVPVYAIHTDLTGVRALPLLHDAAGFDMLDGKLRATIDIRSEGRSNRAIMSNLAGTASGIFRDGAIRGLNVAQMIRSLTAGPLSGWQESREQSTDLSQLSASFRIDRGQATTGDLNLVGPLVKMTGTGTVDLGTKSLALRVEPKLVLTAEGQGRRSDPVGFGIPVTIEGPWAEPRIYPDIAGILDNPDAAYAKLREMGQGLFAPGNPAGNTSQSDALGKLGETLGNLLQQGLSGRRGGSAPPGRPGQNDPSQSGQNNQPMNDILKQLFGR